MASSKPPLKTIITLSSHSVAGSVSVFLSVFLSVSLSVSVHGFVSAVLCVCKPSVALSVTLSFVSIVHEVVSGLWKGTLVKTSANLFGTLQHVDTSISPRRRHGIEAGTRTR